MKRAAFILAASCTLLLPSALAEDAVTTTWSGRREVPDGSGGSEGKGAEDYIQRISPEDLETAWQYSLRDSRSHM